jgi:hypothetical protein
MFATARPIAVLIVLAVRLAASPGAQSPEPVNTLTPTEKSAGWTLLFDGKSTSAWRGYKKPDMGGLRWKIEDGCLALPSGEGADTQGQRDIITTQQFDDFELAWEWRIAKGGNSGVKYFVTENNESAIGHEYQVIDDERHADAKIGPHRQTAAFYDVLPATERPVKPAGEWNTTRIVVRGQTVEHWLNGKKVLQYELGSPALKAAIAKSKFKGIARFGTRQNGHILLQDHGNQVWFRSIKIRRLG